MFKNKIFNGVILVSIGASSYGMLATFVKMAYTEGFSTAEVTISQFVLGLIGMMFIIGFQFLKNKQKITYPNPKNRFQLMLAGTSLGLTSVFYYCCLHYIEVSIAIILLMQTVWMGVFLEAILTKKRPSIQKTAAVFIVLIGTVFASKLLNSALVFSWQGFALGLLSAASFTTTMFTANHIAIGVTTSIRSFYMLLGGAIVVFIFAFFTQHTDFNFLIFLKWGILVSLFGTVIPPLLFNEGFPLTGIGLGSIVASLELPVSVLMAYFLLHEKVDFLQWIGIILIIFAIIIMNIKFKK